MTDPSKDHPEPVSAEEVRRLVERLRQDSRITSYRPLVDEMVLGAADALEALLAERERREAKLARLREALAFYADGASYRSPSGNAWPVILDRGTRASEALALSTGEDGPMPPPSTCAIHPGDVIVTEDGRWHVRSVLLGAIGQESVYEVRREGFDAPNDVDGFPTFVHVPTAMVRRLRETGAALVRYGAALSTRSESER